MKKPIIWNIDDLLRQVDEAIEMLCRYQEKALVKYSERTTSQQRIADVELVLDELNEYALSFAKYKKLAPCNDVRVFFGLWRRLDTWREFLSGCSRDAYLTVMDDQNVYDSPMCYLLQPRQQADSPLHPYVIPKEEYWKFVAAFEASLNQGEDK